MTSLSLILVPMLALQGTGEAPVAITNADPQTWTLVYPLPMRPYVEDYRRCLSGQMRIVSGEANFEMQHRADIPLCADRLEEAVDGAKAALDSVRDFAAFTKDDVRDVFTDLAAIHIARGADLDGQFTFIQRSMQAAQDQYESERPKGLVLELHDASVVKARTDATYQAQQEANGASN